MIATPASDVPARTRGLVCYVGRPEWLSDEHVTAMLAESLAFRAHATVVRSQAHCPVGPAGKAFTQAAELHRLIENHVGNVVPSGNSNYLYYDEPGAKIDPHTDSPDFPLQVLLMLHQSGYTSARRSALAVFPEGPESIMRITLDPGHLVLFKAAEVVHGRTSAGPGERITLIGAGFLPATRSPR
jgi:hypothetical protein